MRGIMTIITTERRKKKRCRTDSIEFNEVKASSYCSSTAYLVFKYIFVHLYASLLFGRLLMYNILIVTLKLDLNGVTPNRLICELNQIDHYVHELEWKSNISIQII